MTKSTGLTVQEKRELLRKEHATGLIAILTDSEKAKAYEKSLTIARIVDFCMPVSEVCKYSGMANVKKAIDIQLTKLVASLNLKWNISDNQVAQIVEDLIEKYPHETIEDFVLVFKRARMGEFGELFRLDGPVIFSWMETYLEEKYRVIEDKLAKEKDEYYKPAKPEDENNWLQKWMDSVKEVNIKPVLPMSDKQVREEGRERPKGIQYVPPAISELRKRELHFQWLSECHDPRTGEPNENYLPEKDWRELNK